jgi:hypothetical protein
MPDEPKPWQPGDRVIVRLPSRGGLGAKPWERWSWFAGTVREVDTGSRPGVRVDLDREVNGVRNCYATHRELRPEVPGD